MTIFFPDVSEYTPNVDVTPYEVVIARATLSTSIADSAYQTYKQRAAGKVFAAYHWLNHGNTAAQAKWCFDHVGPNVPLMIDAEDVAGNTGYAGPLTVADITAFAADFRALGGTASLVYLPFWYWAGPMGAPHQLDQLVPSRLGLVSSNYTAYTNNGPGWAPYYVGAPAPMQWQYTSTPIDMNAFRGTAQQYAQMIGAEMNLTDPLYIPNWDNDPRVPTPTEGSSVGEALMVAQQRSFLALRTAQDIEKKVDALTTAVAALTAPAPVDVTALVAALQAAGFLTKQELNAKLSAAEGA